jgi:hypothetical protein
MSVRLAIHAEDPGDLRLAGLEDAGASAGDPAVAIRLFRGPGDGGGLEIGASGRRVATTGDGLWRRAPWPVNDALFALGEPRPGDGAVVVGGDPAPRADIAGRLAARGLHARERPRLTAADLAEAAMVVYVPTTDPLPVDAMAVLAARRLLVTGRHEPAFGLRPSLDHLVAVNPDQAVLHVIVGLAHWDAYTAIRAWGALSARCHRASEVLPALAADLAADDDLTRAPVRPRGA